MTSLPDTTPAPDVGVFEIEDEILLFQSWSGRLYRLNQTAAVIWKGITVGISVADMANIIVDATGEQADRITTDIDDLIRQWDGFGLFKSSNFRNATHSSPLVDNQIDFDYHGYEHCFKLPNNYPQIRFRILDTTFILKVPDRDILDLVEPLYQHLRMSDQVSEPIRIIVMRTSTRYVLVKDEMIIDWCKDQAGIAPMVHANTLLIAYEKHDCLFGIHSAALEMKGRCIMLPALSGSGKSTLVAAMTTYGFNYLADDLVLLTQAPVRMIPVPVAIGLKSGSWSPMESVEPEVRILTTHQRADKKRVRYLVPSATRCQFPGYNAKKVHGIVFPKYHPDATFVFNPIKKAEAICRITDAGYDAQDGLSTESIHQIIQWITDIPCFELNYSDLEQAAEALQRVIG